MPISPRLQNYFEEYELSHKNKVNLVIHKIAIPLIIFHIFAMLSWVTLFPVLNYPVTLAEIALGGVFIFYLTLNIKYAFILFIFTLICIQIAHHTSVKVVCYIAIFAWIIQLLGHSVWEKKSPAFSKNFIQLLTGPLFFLHKI